MEPMIVATGQRLCRPSQFECKNGRCISKQLVCDGYDDCTDNSDEQDCHIGCRFGQCSQICNVKKNGTHTCACAEGYTLHSWSQKNQKSCFADGNLAYMILANDNHLRKLSPYKHGNSAGILTLTEEDAPKVLIESADVLYGENPQAFWTNRHQKTLVTMSVPTTDESGSNRSGRTARDANAGYIRTLIEGLKNPKGVAVDWVTKTVYYIDAGTSTISAVTTDGKKRVTLIGTGLGHPFDIVVDPASGQIFWTDNGGLINPRIEVARMNGSYRRDLVGGAMVWPTGLAIDYPARRLYWTDTKTKTIETVRLDGSDRNIVKKFGHDEEIPYKLDVFEDLLYVTTLHTNTIYRMSKFGGRQNNLVKITQYPLKLSDVVLVQEKKQDTSRHLLH
ncbi:hypothetical protein Anas_07530 [Armadillidium nasatum]|uniref:Uncharacterized protein n=1 Tax=Armadillidium nasatum TaxID=96803 RepID=A0A5N5TGK9_9CRUS|nr:hypothetical protein Anas_07530 [Armadillidium nasatum]